MKPTDAVVSLTEAYQQLRIDTFGSPPTSPEESKVTALIAAITESLDAGTGWLGRALAPQTWRLSLRDFPVPCRGINLPYPPLIEVVSVTYTDGDGATQTLTQGTDFRVIDSDQGAILLPTYSNNWPVDVRDDYDAVQITFRCGYVEGSPEAVAVPEQIKNYILASLTDQFDSRGVDAPGVTSKVSAAIENSLNNIRVYWP